MGFRKVKYRKNIIEFWNDWKGVETVIVNNQLVSKKFSLLGTTHDFKISEKGISKQYTLTSKTGAIGQTLLDLKCNGKLVKKNLWVFFGSKTVEENNFKAKGIKELNEYDIPEAIEYLNKALNLNNQDPEIYFYLACCYSVSENSKEAFECIKKAVKYKLNDHDMIVEHDMLSYIRTQSEFEKFKKSKYKKYDKSNL